MDKYYFIDTLFDLINESDELEAEIQDVQVNKSDLIVKTKDGSKFIVQVNSVE